MHAPGAPLSSRVGKEVFGGMKASPAGSGGVRFRDGRIPKPDMQASIRHAAYL